MTRQRLLIGERIRLDGLGDHATDAQEICDFALRNRAHLEKWSPPLPDNYYTEIFWRDAVQKSIDGERTGSRVNFVMRDCAAASGGPIIGTITLSEIVRGAFQACYLGYNIDATYEGKGLMQDGLRLAIEYAFEDLKLHRIMANYRPENERSAKTLKALGFVIEGVAKDYLYSGGAWRDHVLTSLTNANALPGAT